MPKTKQQVLKEINEERKEFYYQFKDLLNQTDYCIENTSSIIKTKIYVLIRNILSTTTKALKTN